MGQQLAARPAAMQARLRRQNLPALAHNRLEIVQLLSVLIRAWQTAHFCTSPRLARKFNFEKEGRKVSYS